MLPLMAKTTSFIRAVDMVTAAVSKLEMTLSGFLQNQWDLCTLVGTDSVFANLKVAFPGLSLSDLSIRFTAPDSLKTTS